MNKNSIKTAAILALFGALFLGVGSLFGTGGLVIGLLLGLVFVGGSYWFSDTLAVKAARAEPVSEQQAPQLYAIVRDLTTRAGMPMPKIYISPAQQPNAFATGRNPEHAAVAVTQGLMQVVTEDELRGVLAHEISHVRHRDILIASVAAALAMAIMFVARLAIFSSLFGGGRDNDGGNAIGAILMLILAPIAALLLQGALSRSREFDADLGGAELVGNGEPLASALAKIDGYAKQVKMDVDPAHASLFIVNPLSGRKMQFANLFTTHPPTEERIARLRAYSRTAQDSGIDVVLLGTGNPLPDANRAGAATLVRAGGKHLLFDAGRGAVMRLAAAGAVPRMLDAVLLTHLHSDHISDLNDVVTTHWVMSFEPATLRVYGPPRTREVVEAMQAMLRPDVEYRLAHHADLTWEPSIEVIEVEPGVVFEDAGVRIVAAATDHRPVEPTVGYRIEHDGAAVVIAGDTVPCASLDELCCGAAVYVQTVLRDDLVRMVPAPRFVDTIDYHSTVVQAAETAARAGVGTLVLTHQIPTPAPGSTDEWIAIAREHYTGEIVFGEDLTTVTT